MDRSRYPGGDGSDATHPARAAAGRAHTRIRAVSGQALLFGATGDTVMFRQGALIAIPPNLNTKYWQRSADRLWVYPEMDHACCWVSGWPYFRTPAGGIRAGFRAPLQ